MPNPCDCAFATHREAREQARMGSEASAIRCAFGHDQEWDDSRGAPAEGRRDGWYHSLLYIELAEKILNLRDDRLDLDDDDCLGRFVISEQVDTAAIAKMVEARFGNHGPTRGLETPHEPFRQEGMVGVSQPPELRAAVAGVPGQSHVERGTDAPERGDREGVSVSALQQTDQ